MKRLVFVLLFGAIIITSLAQDNLVPNPSFEDKNHCPVILGDLEAAIFWLDPNSGSSDYFNECDSTNIVGVPNNVGGYANAYTGFSYAGFATYHLETREYIQSQLSSPLVAQKKYHVEFYVNLCDSCNHASNEMGAYFSLNAPSNTTGSPFEVAPQVNNNLVDSLNDKINWMKVSGEFIAEGGEHYITIGNFKSNVATDVYEVPGGGVIWTEVLAYYYIDDVSVVLDTTTGVNELEQVKFEVYPNPTKNNLVVETDVVKNTSLIIFDLTGRIFISVPLQAVKTSIDISDLPRGIYVAVLEQNGNRAARRKIVVN